MSRRFHFLVFAALLAIGELSSSAAFAQNMPTPQLMSLFPAGGKAGTAVEVTVTGSDLDEISQLLFSAPGLSAKLKEDAPPVEATAGKKGRRGQAKQVANVFAVTIDGNVAPGIYEARVIGRFGISNPRIFVVGSHDEVLEASGNNSASTPQEIAVGTVVNGRADQNNKDYYKLTFKQGQRIIVDCQAERIDSRMDATLAVLNSDGRELARNRDTEGEDPVVDFVAPVDGVYTIAVYDFTYGGGADYAYRLLVHSAPQVDFVFPPSGTPGTQGPFTIYGRNLPGSQPASLMLDGSPLEKVSVNIPVPSDPIARRQLSVESFVLPRSSFLDAFEYRLPSPQGAANPVTIGIAEQPLVVEQDNNDTPDKAQVVSVPSEVVGQFYPQSDRDYVQFDAKKGEVIFIDVLSHRLGLDSDPALLIQRVTKNDKGEETVADVANVDDPQDRNTRIGSDFDTSTDDPSYRLVVNDDATYRLLLRDNFGESRSDPRYVYRLIIRREQPDFRVAAFLDPPTTQQMQNQVPLGGPVLRRGGTMEIRVNVDRRDQFQGEVTVGVEGLPAGVTCPGAVIGGDNERGSLIFTAADNVAPWSGPIKVIAKATINGQEETRVARIGTLVWGTTDRNQRPPEYRVSQDFVLATMDKEMQPALVQIGEDKVYETSRGGNLEIPVKITRREGCADGIKLTKSGLPNEINIKEINVAGGTNDGKLEMQLNQQNIKAGTYTFVMQAETKIKYARNPDAIKAAEKDVADFAEVQKQLNDELTKANNDKNTATQQAQQAATEKTQAEQNKNNTATAAQQATANAKAASDKLAQAKDAAGKEAGNQALVDAVNAAQKAADDAAAQAKVAEEAAAAADKALTAALEKLKLADEAKVKAEQVAKEAQDEVNMANQEKPKLDQRLNEVKNQNQPKDMQMVFASLPVKVRIVDSPLKLTAGQSPASIKQGEKIELPVTIERLFGFADTVEVILESPGVNGLNVQKADIPKDQPQGKLMLTANKDATPGEHNVTLKARARFNNVQVETSQPLVLKIEKVEAQ